MEQFSIVLLTGLLLFFSRIVHTYQQHDFIPSTHLLTARDFPKILIRSGSPPRRSSGPSSSRQSTRDQAGSSRHLGGEPEATTETSRKASVSPVRRTKNDVMKAHPVSVLSRTHGPAVVNGWEGKAGSNAPHVPAGKTLDMSLSHPESAMVHVEHDSKEAKTIALAAGKVGRAAAKEDYHRNNRPIWDNRSRVIDPQKNTPEKFHKPWGKVKAEDIMKPAQIIGELHGIGKFGIEAQNHDSESESD